MLDKSSGSKKLYKQRCVVFGHLLKTSQTQIIYKAPIIINWRDNRICALSFIKLSFAYMPEENSPIVETVAAHDTISDKEFEDMFIKLVRGRQQDR